MGSLSIEIAPDNQGRDLGWFAVKVTGDHVPTVEFDMQYQSKFLRVASEHEMLEAIFACDDECRDFVSAALLDGREMNVNIVAFSEGAIRARSPRRPSLRDKRSRLRSPQ